MFSCEHITQGCTMRLHAPIVQQRSGCNLGIGGSTLFYRGKRSCRRPWARSGAAPRVEYSTTWPLAKDKLGFSRSSQSQLDDLLRQPGQAADELRLEDRSVPRVEAPQGALPVVVLPGFANCTRDYLEPFGDADAGVVAALQRRGFSPYVLQVERKDWLKVAKALFTRAYWSSSCTTHPGYSWYLERLKELVDQARLETGCDQVDLIGHSAGGWLGRAFIGQQQYRGSMDSSDDEPHEAVRSLITLGTPHMPPPPQKGRCMTGGALAWVNNTWPGAYFAGHGVKYVCVGSRAVVGDGSKDKSTLSGYAHGSYIQVCGDGDGVEGDAVVPLCSALLQGAEHIVLDGVLHSMSRIRTFDEKSDDEWYGSESVVDTWLHHLA